MSLGKFQEWAPTWLLIAIVLLALPVIGLALSRPKVEVYYANPTFPESLTAAASHGRFTVGGSGEHILRFPGAPSLSLTAFPSVRTVVVPNGAVVDSLMFHPAWLNTRVTVSQLLKRTSQFDAKYGLALKDIKASRPGNSKVILSADETLDAAVIVSSGYQQSDFGASGTFRIAAARPHVLRASLNANDTSFRWTARPTIRSLDDRYDRIMIVVETRGIDSVAIDSAAHGIPASGSAVIFDSVGGLMRIAEPAVLPEVELTSGNDRFARLYLGPLRNLATMGEGAARLHVGAADPISIEGLHRVKYEFVDGHFSFESAQAGVTVTGTSSNVIWQGEQLVRARWRAWPESLVVPGVALFLASVAGLIYRARNAFGRASAQATTQ